MAKHPYSRPLLVSILPMLAVCLSFSLWFSPASAQTEGPFGGTSLSSALDESPFLRVMDAFIPTLRWDQNRQAQLDWYIEPDYYLYRARFVYQSDSAAEITASYPAGVTKYDEFFQEDLEVYYSNLLVALDIPEDTQSLYVQFQGCAEAGLCYPPTWIGFDIDLNTGSAGYMGELPSGPPTELDSAPLAMAASPNSAAETDSSDDGLPITLLIGFFSGLAVLTGIVIFSLRKDK